MNADYIIAYSGVIIWALVPIRQYKNRFFYFFLLLTCADVITLVARTVFKSGTNFFIVPFNFLALTALLDINFIRKHKILLLILLLSICIISIQKTILQIPDYQIMAILMIIINVFILYIFIKELFINSGNKRFINLYLIVLVLYAIMEVTKFLNYLTGFTNGYFYFKATIYIEVLVAIFFVIFKADNKRLFFQLK